MNKGRPRAQITKQLELISARCGMTPKHLKTLVSQGMPTDLEQAIAWLNHRPSPKAESDSAADLRRERIRLTRAHSEKAELELSIRRGEFISRDEAHVAEAQIGQAISAMHRALERGLPPKICGKSESAMRGIIRDELIEVMTRLKEGHSDFWKQHPLNDEP